MSFTLDQRQLHWLYSKQAVKKSNTELLKWTDKWTFLYIQSELVPAQAIVELLQNCATKRPNRLWQEFKIFVQQKTAESDLLLQFNEKSFPGLLRQITSD